MVLYRYLSINHAVDALEQRRLKVGKLNELNDPFGCFPRVINLPSDVVGFGLGFATGMLDSWSTKFGIVCYSGTIEDPVLWSHYCTGHRGIALGFEVPASEMLVKVAYRNERPELDFRELNVSTAEEAVRFAKTTMAHIFSVKALSWSYEQEYRQFFLFESCIAARGMYFTELPLLKRIVIGARCEMSTHYFDHFLRQSEFKDVSVIKAARSRRSYKIEAD